MRQHGNWSSPVEGCSDHLGLAAQCTLQESWQAVPGYQQDRELVCVPGRDVGVGMAVREHAVRLMRVLRSQPPA